jgi:hypothetical protein
MQIEQNIIVTSTDEIAALQRHIGLNELSGQINLTIKGDDVEVWQPSKEVVNDGVAKPKIILMPAIKVKHDIGFRSDEQPSDNCTH